MVRGAALVLMLTCCTVYSSVLVPTYVLPPDSFVRDQRSLVSPPDSQTGESQRTIKRLIGGHIKIKPEKEHGSPKNSINFSEKSESGKFAGVVAPDQSGGNVGWNQGIWDDGMLMSSAGEGKETKKIKEDDEDKKTLSDQVAEGKYGLIQNELFSKTPKRPGILSYEPNSETRSKDNLQNLGGLKKDEIWLAEDHLLVIKGGSFPERTNEAEQKVWPPIDNYEAPRRQVKLPNKPKIPPPFPVRLSDDGPLIFLTPNGSIPAPVFPAFSSGEGEGPLPPPSFFYPGTFDSPSDNQRNTTPGGAPLPGPPFPFLPGNVSEGAFPFPASINGSFPEGFPPGAAFLPPPSNQSDLYDEDDPSIYYPPPYNFSYRNDYKGNVPAGPLVPGIILPPPPDFFAPFEETTTEENRTTPNPPTYTRTKSTSKRPSPTPVTYRGKYKARPMTTESPKTTEVPTTLTTPSNNEIPTTIKYRKTQRVIPNRQPVKVYNQEAEIITRPKTEKPVFKSRTKLTSKPLSVSVIYDYPEVYENKPPTTTQKPYIAYNLPEKAVDDHVNDISSTAVPLRAYYTNIQNDEIPTTKLQPVYNRKPNENAVASFYFFDEQPKTKAPETYFDGRNYYQTVPSQPSYVHKQNINQESQYQPGVDVAYGSFDQADAFFLFPQKQGPRTLTQEYFSIQKPRPQPTYVQKPKQRPDTFYQQIADIQQTIDYFTTKKPKANTHRPHTNKQKPVTSRPVYQYSYETNPRPEKLTFRAPKLDPEPFRPMVSYSKPFNVVNEFNAISSSASPGYHHQYLVENVQVSTASPTSTRYYQKTKQRDEDYEDAPVKEALPLNNINQIPVQTGKPVHHVNRHPSTTPNPISNGYYTKHDERYIDDITKGTFDIFGQKLDDGSRDVNGLAVTPPLETVKTPIDNNINLQYEYEIVESQSPNPPSLHGDTNVNNREPRPPINPDSEPVHPSQASAQLVNPHIPQSLAGDTIVNDRYPRPPINLDSEFIPIPNPNYQRAQQYREQPIQHQYTGEQYDLNRPSLVGDTNVNYRRPLPPVNPDAEWIGPVNTAGEGRPGSLIRYRLPGDGAHVYFLTPQAAQAARERYRTPGYGR